MAWLQVSLDEALAPAWIVCDWRWGPGLMIQSPSALGLLPERELGPLASMEEAVGRTGNRLHVPTELFVSSVMRKRNWIGFLWPQ